MPSNINIKFKLPDGKHIIYSYNENESIEFIQEELEHDFKIKNIVLLQYDKKLISGTLKTNCIENKTVIIVM